MNTLHLDVDELEQLMTDLFNTWKKNVHATKDYHGSKRGAITMFRIKSFEREWVEEPGTRHQNQRDWQRHIYGHYERVRFQRWEAHSLTKVQAVVRGVLTRRVVHTAMCSPDADALPRAIDYCQRASIKCPPFPKIV